MKTLYLILSIFLFSPSISLFAQCNLQLSVNASSTTCYASSDGFASAIASGGSSPYNYQWSNGATNNINPNIPAGTYYITVTDSDSCVLVDSVIVIEPNPVLVDVSVDTNVICGGTATGAATATVSGGLPPLSYNWESGENTASATALEAGTQVLTVIDNNGCIGRDTFSLTEPPIIEANESITNETVNGDCDGSISINPSGGTGPLQFFWYNGDTTSTTITDLCSGNYTIVIIDSIGCSDVFDFTVDFDANVAINQPEFLELSCYPNPIQNDFLYIEGLPLNSEYEVYNNLGQLIFYERNTSSNSFKIDTQNWGKGVYYLNFKTEKGAKQSLKVVK